MHTQAHGGRWTTRYSWPNQTPYQVWENPVPRIADRYLRCAVYIYENRQDAEDGVHQGGSGFLVTVPFDTNSDWLELYVVTNRHALIDPKTLKTRNPVVRLNRKDGTVEYFETHFNQWSLHRDGDDVAVLPLRFTFEDIDFSVVELEEFITPDIISREDIGIGDDTFMVGRFVNHEGRQQNAPAIRFGNIAMMPKEKITSPYGIDQESFLVEVRSLPGYSGSAVFLFSPGAEDDMSVRRDGIDRVRKNDTAFDSKSPHEQREILYKFTQPKGPYLLGIDWCHIPRKASILNRDGKRIDEGWYVEENTGMAGVIPAWKIAEILDSEELKMQRKVTDDEVTKKKQSSIVSLDYAEKPPATQITPEGAKIPIPTQEQFLDDLTKASRKIKPD